MKADEEAVRETLRKHRQFILDSIAGGIYMHNEQEESIDALLALIRQARIKTAGEIEVVALKAATRNTRDTLDTIIAIGKYIKELHNGKVE